MNQEQIWNDFTTLPREAQQQVADYIAFLRSRYALPRPGRRAKRVRNLADEPFIGMWSGCQDMQDSSVWVRQVREREWGNPRE